MAEILVIEDEEAVRSTIRQILESGGHGVSEATDGEDGFAVLGEVSPDLILCDITMPRLSGYEFLKELRERDPQFAELPFLFLSAHAERQDILEGLGLGADDYLTKPIDSQMLLAKVAAALRQVARMRKKKTEEQVKLYKALSQKALPKRVRDPAARPSQPPPGPSDQQLAQTFERKLQDVVGQGDKGAAGKVQFINFSELKKRLGDRWHKVARTAMSVGEMIVKQHLKGDAVFGRHGSDGFFILFPDLNEEQAGFEVESIANEICVKLLGENDDACRQISLTSAAKEIKELVGDGATPSLGGLAKAFEKHTEPVRNRAGRVQNVADRVLEQATVKYLPIWRPQSERVVAYQACACLQTGANIFPVQGSWGDGADDPLASGVRIAMAEKVAAYLKSTVYKPGRAAVSLPLHFSTLAGGSRKRIEQVFDELPLSELRELLMVELIVPPTGIEARAISDALEFAKRRCRQVIVRCSPKHPRAAYFVEAGAAILSMQLAAQRQGRRTNSVYKGLKSFAQDAIALKVEPYVFGLDAAGSVRPAILAGFRLLAGRAIAREEERPREVYMLPKQRFIAG